MPADGRRVTLQLLDAMAVFDLALLTEDRADEEQAALEVLGTKIDWQLRGLAHGPRAQQARNTREPS